MNNILKFKNKPQWKYLDDVGELSAVIISDAENFPKFFITWEFSKEEMKKIRDEKYPELKDTDLLNVISGNIENEDDHFIKEGNEYTSCIRNNHYTGYQVPLDNPNDTGVPVLARIIDKPTNVSSQDTKVFTHIFVFNYYLLSEDFFDLINKGYEFKKTKVCSVDIYSKKIGIGLNHNIGLAYNSEDPLPRAQCVCDCYLGNGTYDIFQIDIEKKIIPQNKDALELDRKYFGTLIELDSKENFTTDDIIKMLKLLIKSGKF